MIHYCFDLVLLVWIALRCTQLIRHEAYPWVSSLPWIHPPPKKAIPSIPCEAPHPCTLSNTCFLLNIRERLITDWLGSLRTICKLTHKSIQCLHHHIDAFLTCCIGLQHIQKACVFSIAYIAFEAVVANSTVQHTFCFCRLIGDIRDMSTAGEWSVGLLVQGFVKVDPRLNLIWAFVGDAVIALEETFKDEIVMQDEVSQLSTRQCQCYDIFEVKG